MRIAIDASRTTAARITGTEHYALQLIRGIIQHNTRHQLDLYFRDIPPQNLFTDSEFVYYHVIPFKRAWTHLRFAAAIWQIRPDVTFVPAHTLPFLFPGKALVTVHDLGYKHFPEAHTRASRLYLDLTTRYSAKRATQILADSQATADDLNRFYRTPHDKISVVYPGVDAPPIHEVDVHAKYGLPERYFLFIGTLQPRKNIARIVQAYARYQQQHDDPAALVLAGGKGWLFDESWIANTKNVYLPGYVDEADKGALYANAVALVFPTLFEGFGFPVLEAMHCGTPVIASTTSSLPELVGDAGLQVDPEDTKAIAEAMIKLDTDATLRELLVQKAYQQVKAFNWDHSARQTLQIMEEIGG